MVTTLGLLVSKKKNYLGASAIIFEGLLDPAILEAQACSEALALAKDLHVQSICVASDSLEAVTRITDDSPCRFFAIWQFGNLANLASSRATLFTPLYNAQI